MRERKNVTIITAALTITSLQLVSFMFVDDKDLLTIANKEEPHCSLLQRAQAKLTDWQRGLEVTRGALKQKKMLLVLGDTQMAGRSLELWEKPTFSRNSHHKIRERPTSGDSTP